MQRTRADHRREQFYRRTVSLEAEHSQFSGFKHHGEAFTCVAVVQCTEGGVSTL